MKIGSVHLHIPVIGLTMVTNMIVVGKFTCSDCPVPKMTIIGRYRFEENKCR